jgi:hypothetical protein
MRLKSDRLLKETVMYYSTTHLSPLGPITLASDEDNPLSVTESGLDERIAAMVSAAIYAFDPELVVIDSKTTPERVEKWRQWVSKYGMRATVAGSECNSQTRFCVSALGSDGPLIGAACMVLESFFTDPIGQLAKLSISPQWNLSQVVRN